MQLLDYVVLNHRGSDETVRGTAADLILDIPYLIVDGQIPPRAILNEVLGRGLVDAGMSGGCRWTSFQLSESDFADVLTELRARGGKRGETLRFEAPRWVDRQWRWTAWLAYRKFFA